MATFVPVSREAFAEYLAPNRFRKVLEGDHKEVVYQREHASYTGLYLSVYTSLTEGEEAVRPAGTDAVRVTLTYKNAAGRVRGVKKFSRVLRVVSEEGTIARLRGRVNEAKAWTQENIVACPRCGAPAYRDSGKCLAGCLSR